MIHCLSFSLVCMHHRGKREREKKAGKFEDVRKLQVVYQLLEESKILLTLQEDDLPGKEVFAPFQR